MDFVVNGTRYSLTKQEVEARMRGVEPGQIYQYTIEVNGIRYPVKQVLRTVTGQEDFTTHQARNVLRRLGFVYRSTASAPGSEAEASEVTEPPPVWVLEIQTLTGSLHEFELDQEEDIQALEAEISRKIGSDGSYQGSNRRVGAVRDVGLVTIAWRHVIAAALYQRQVRPAA